MPRTSIRSKPAELVQHVRIHLHRADVEAGVPSGYERGIPGDAEPWQSMFRQLCTQGLELAWCLPC